MQQRLGERGEVDAAAGTHRLDPERHRQVAFAGAGLADQMHDLVAVNEVELITAAGAELRYLPRYSPDMNPIEKAHSKLKAFLRKIAERTVAGILAALDACADIFKPAECENYFRACGYETDGEVNST